jgi:hypothetical protein
MAGRQARQAGENGRQAGQANEKYNRHRQAWKDACLAWAGQQKVSLLGPLFPTLDQFLRKILISN